MTTQARPWPYYGGSHAKPTPTELRGFLAQHGLDRDHMEKREAMVGSDGAVLAHCGYCVRDCTRCGAPFIVAESAKEGTCGTC